MNIVELPNARDAGTPPPFIVFCRAAGFFITEMERSGKDGFRFLVIWCFGSLVAGSVIAVRRLVEKKVMGFGLRRRQVAGSRVGGRDDRSVRFASLNGTLRGASEREPGSSRGSGYRRRRFRNDGRAAGPGAWAGTVGCQRPGMVERRSIADLLGLREAVVDAEDDQDEFAGDAQDRRADDHDCDAGPDHGFVGAVAAGGSGHDAAAPDDEDQRADPKGDLDERWGGESSEGEEVAEGVYARFGGR